MGSSVFFKFFSILLIALDFIRRTDCNYELMLSTFQEPNVHELDNLKIEKEVPDQDNTESQNEQEEKSFQNILDIDRIYY